MVKFAVVDEVDAGVALAAHEAVVVRLRSA
jgi:hypothetical protein